MDIENNAIKHIFILNDVFHFHFGLVSNIFI